MTAVGSAGISLGAILLAYLIGSVSFAVIVSKAMGLAAFVGHLFPVYHRFAGGKGVATAAGVLVALNPIHGLATLATWIIIAFFFRYSSLAALVAAVFAPFYWVLLFGARPRVLVIVAMSALLIWRHRKNIANLLAGKESRLGSKAGDTAAQAKARKGGHRRIV